MTTNKRIEYIDEIKGIAIFLMVLGHVVGCTYEDYKAVCIFSPELPTNVKWGGVIWQIIYSFHMPLFFMVSGFLTYKAYRWSDTFQFCKKKIIRLFIPWVCTIWISYLRNGSVGYWFLLCLFVISILSYFEIVIMEKINARKRLVVDLAAVFAILVFFHCLPLHDKSAWGVQYGQFMGGILSFLIGILMRKYNQIYKLVVESSWIYTCAIVLFIVLFSARYIPNDSLLYVILYLKLGFVKAILGSLVVFHICANDALSAIRSFLSYLGRHTMPIYILHFLFILHLYKIGEYILLQPCAISSITLQITYGAIASLIAIGLSIATYKIISVSPHLKLLMFGEK